MKKQFTKLKIFATGIFLCCISLVSQAQTLTCPDFTRFTKHFNEPTKGTEFVMPVGSGDLAAMVSFDNALQLHLSKTDWLGFPILGESPNNAGGSNKAVTMSPGHVTISFGKLDATDITGFDQYMDYARGSVRIRIETKTGPLELEVFGEMTQKALIVQVTDRRKQSEKSLVSLTNWRETMSITANGSELTGEEIHRILMNRKVPADPAQIPANDVIYNQGLGLVVTAKDAIAKDGKLEIAANKQQWNLIITAAKTRDGNPVKVAQQNAAGLLAQNSQKLRNRQLDWWKNYNNKSWVEIQGDSDAEYLTRLWQTNNYSFAGIFGGDVLPPTFQGSQALVMKDYASWTGAYTWQNTRELIWPMGAANHTEFARFYFKTYDRYFQLLQKMTAATKKTGIRIPEYIFQKDDPTLAWKANKLEHPATPFNKSFLDDKSDRTFEDHLPGHIEHINADGGEFVQLLFDYVKYTGDEAFLKEVGVPWLRECTLYYLKYITLGSDGFWHMQPSNAAETWWKIKDPLTDICAIRYCFEQVVKHGKQFGYEPEFIQYVAERLEKLAPIPTGKWNEKDMTDEEFAQYKKDFPNKRTTMHVRFVGIDKDSLYYACGAGVDEYPTKNNFENPELYVVYPFTRVGIESKPKDLQRGINTFNGRKCINTYGWSPDGVQAARLGLNNTPEVILNHALRQQPFPYGGWINCANCLPGTVTKVPKTSARCITDTPQFDTQGVNMTAIQEMLFQSHDLAENEKLLDGGVIRLLPAIRKTWSGSFKLRARGGFMVTCQFQKGTVTRTVIQSESGRTLSLQNPYSVCQVILNGKANAVTSDKIVLLNTKPGDVFEFVSK
ncbi:MAG: glycoside hydrolase family 95-like protein [Paludibacter sp.]